MFKRKTAKIYMAKSVHKQSLFNFILSLIIYSGVYLFTPSVSFSLTCKALFEKKSQIETINDVLAKYRLIVLENSKLDLNTISKLDFNEFKQIRFEKVDGKGNSGSYTGNLNGSDIFIKISNFGNGNAGFAERSLRHIYNEIKFALILQKIGLGPKFFGLTITPSGSIGLVYERINGKPVQLIESYNTLTDEQHMRLKVIEIILNASGIQPRDFSFIADENGKDIYLIDSEFYQIVEPFSPGISYSFHANRKGIKQVFD